MFFKWIHQGRVAIYLVSHTFDFVMAIFEMANNGRSRCSGVITATQALIFRIALLNNAHQLETMGIGELLGPVLETLLVSLRLTVMGAPHHGHPLRQND